MLGGRFANAELCKQSGDFFFVFGECFFIFVAERLSEIHARSFNLKPEIIRKVHCCPPLLMLLVSIYFSNTQPLKHRVISFASQGHNTKHLDVLLKKILLIVY